MAGLLGEPFTAMGSWYDYNQTTHMVAPMAVVYVVQLPGGQHVKLRIAGYYGDPANPMRGANYDLEWAPLP